MDADVTKYVSVDQMGNRVTVRVRYATDVVLHDDIHRLRAAGPIEVGADQHGVKISYETAHLFGLVRWRRSTRF